MSEESNFTIRLSKVMREFNVGRDTIIEFLAKKGFQVNPVPNTKLTAEMYALLVKEFQGEKDMKNESKRLGNISYRGGSVSIESNSYTSAVANPEKIKEIEKRRKQKKEERKLKKEERFAKQNEKPDEKKEKTIEAKIELKIPFSELEFGYGLVSITYNEKQYVYINPSILNYDNSLESVYNRVHETTKNRIKAFRVRVIIDIGTGSFVFQDIDICKYVNSIINSYSFLPKNKKPEKSNELLSKTNEKKEERKRTINAKIEYRVPFSYLKFNQGFVSITYKNKCYIYRDDDIKDYDKIIERIYSRISKAIKWFEKMAKQGDAEASIDIQSTVARKNKIRNLPVKVLIDLETETFTFTDIDVHKYINDLKESYLTKNQGVESYNEIPSKKNPSETPLTALKSMILGAGNIHFYNGYYLIFQTNNGEVDNSVTPYRVDDSNSQEILNLVHKFFEQKLEQKRIIVKIDETRIIEPSKLDLFKLSDYVRELKRNLEVKGVWWDEVQNYRKPSLKQCRSVSAEVTKKKVSLKNGYLDSLVSMQSEIKLIPVYEVNHGKEEAAFIFSINIPNNRCAVVFENASNDAATATWVFVTKIEDYESCINFVFDYFTDYTIFKKRFSLRLKTVNPPEKFKAENYTFIDHDDLKQWLKKLNKILEQTPEPSEIQFVPGLHIPQSSKTRKGHNETIATKNLHNQLIRKLYNKLCIKYGQDNVGTENRVGTKRVDVVVKGDGFYDFYEIKTAANAYDCVKEALGQLFLYAFLSCSRVRKMVVVGTSEAPKEFEQHLSTQRKNNSLQLYYMKV